MTKIEDMAAFQVAADISLTMRNEAYGDITYTDAEWPRPRKNEFVLTAEDEDGRTKRFQVTVEEI